MADKPVEIAAKAYAEADDGEHADWVDANYRRDRMTLMRLAFQALSDVGYVVVPKNMVLPVIARLEHACDTLTENGKHWEWRLQSLALCEEIKSAIAAAEGEG